MVGCPKRSSQRVRGLRARGLLLNGSWAAPERLPDCSCADRKLLLAFPLLLLSCSWAAPRWRRASKKGRAQRRHKSIRSRTSSRNKSRTLPRRTLRVLNISMVDRYHIKQAWKLHRSHVCERSINRSYTVNHMSVLDRSSVDIALIMRRYCIDIRTVCR